MLNEAKHREAPSNIGVWKQRTNFLNISFRKKSYEWKKKILFLSLKSIFEVNLPDPARPGPTVTLFDALYLRTYCRYEFQILTLCSQTV